MKPSELRDKDVEELVELESELREKLIRLRVAKASSKSVNTAQIGQIRRDIARIKTIQTERQRAGASAGE
jgi:large subunit ribosomal protein L29